MVISAKKNNKKTKYRFHKIFSIRNSLSQNCSGFIFFVGIRVRGFRGFMKRIYISFAHVSNRYMNDFNYCLIKGY